MSQISKEKQMKIVDAVNGMRAVDALSRFTTVRELEPEVFMFGSKVTSDTICTIEEYNQCVSELRRHYDIPEWGSYNRADKELLTVENSDQSFYEKETFVYGQDVYVDSMLCDEGFKFGCLSLNGMMAIILLGDDHFYVPLSSLSSKPIKSKEDIELEEAKEDQINSILKILNDTKTMKFNMAFTRKMLKIMQENGDLAPVKLTE